MNTANKFEELRYIPQDSVPVTREGVDAIVYLYFNEGLHSTSAIAYAGKATKPAWHYRYSNAERAHAKAQEFLDGVAQRHAAKVEQKAQRKAFKTSLKVGEILSYSWGYDQTNVSFYEVVAVSATGKTVTVRKIGQDSVAESAGYMSEYRVPVPGNYIDEPMRKPVRDGDRVPMKFGSASKWNGEPEYCSWYA